MIYLDHNATAPLAPGVLERMRPFLEAPGNASSAHAAGQRARQAVDDAREAVARALGCEPKELVFTSGGTEANNLALRGTVRPGAGARLVVSAIEHPSVRETARVLASQGVEVVELPVDEHGLLRWEAVERAIVPGTSLVSVMWVNNETGVIQPIERLGLLCRERGVPLHVDAVQAFGKLDIDLARLPVDMLSISAHKIGGPQGAGALFLRRARSIAPMQTGGHQERGRRTGTENVAALVGFGVASDVALRHMNRNSEHIAALSRDLERRLRDEIPDLRVSGEAAPRVANTIHLCFRGVEGEALLMALDLAGICASSGSACSSGSLEPSHVLAAMGIPAEWARGALRISLGPSSTREEIDEVTRRLPELVRSLRASSRRRSA